MDNIYAAIDLKSFYASVECVARGLDPLTTNLVVADASRTEKTICLAVSPALKTFGIPGRPRLFEVVSTIRNINLKRQGNTADKKLKGSSVNTEELSRDKSLAVDYLIAPPRMSHYMEISSKIYGIYLNHISADDIQVYSIDEVFIDLTGYVKSFRKSAHELTMQLINEVYKETGITATAGIGTNLYLAKVAMDIDAKHSPPDKNGVRIAELNEQSYRERLWNHKPITDFWRVGKGYAKRLAEKGLYTMGDIAKCSLGSKKDFYSEDLLYDLFGVNAELLIDHAWGWEPCTIADIKSYKSENNSISSGQVLSSPYTFDDAKLIVREMTDDLSLSLVSKGLVCDQVVLSIHYDRKNLTDAERARNYNGPVKKDYYGREAPKPSHGSHNIGRFTSSSRLLTDAMMELYDQVIDKNLLIRHIYVIFNHVYPQNSIPKAAEQIQLDLFTDYNKEKREEEKTQEKLDRENRLQQSILDLKRRYGKNAILKGMNLQDKATQKERNQQVGGHKS